MEKIEKKIKDSHKQFWKKEDSTPKNKKIVKNSKKGKKKK